MPLREPRVLERIGIARRRLLVDVEPHRQTLDLRVEQDLLALFRQQEFDERLGGALILGIGDDADIGGNDRRHGRVDELDREARRLGGQSEEVDDDADAVLAAVDGVRHAERSVGHLRKVAADLEQRRPAFVPAFALQDGLDREMRGAGARRRRNPDMPEVDRLLEIVPLARRGDVVRLEIARVVHDAVAGRGEADEIAVRIVDRIRADLRRRCPSPSADTCAAACPS